MASGSVTLTISDTARVFNAIADEAPIGNSIDPNTGLVYTKANWAKKWLDDLLTKKVSRYETKLARVTAIVAEDPTLITVS